MNQATQDFIRQHQDDDVRQLAFLGSKYPEVDMPFALDHHLSSSYFYGAMLL